MDVVVVVGGGGGGGGRYLIELLKGLPEAAEP